MTFIGVFLNALLGTALIGAASKYVIDLFSVSRPARFGGYCVAIGFAVGRYAQDVALDRNLLGLRSLQ